MATWRVEVDLDGHTPYAEGGVPRPEALAAREGTLLAEDGPTEQYPAEFARKMSQGAPGKALYEKTYQARSFSLLTLVPIRPRSRGERRFLRTLLPGASLRPRLGFNPDAPPATPFNFN